MAEGAMVGVVMGSKSDFEIMRVALDVLTDLGISWETRVVSAHRTPDLLSQYAKTSMTRGLKVIIAGAGGAAHLPGMLAANTLLPVLGVPIAATSLNGIDALLSIVQMPRGVPVATLAIGAAGAANAALLAAQILSIENVELLSRLALWRQERSKEVIDQRLPA